MGKINKLSQALANQIAAGEVIERPASVIKELIENAIDAHATRIDIDVEQGGQKLIQVADDGDGMGADDLALAFQRHATSKISKAGDLAAISSLGFRGEALPSIGSVAQVLARSTMAGEEGHEFRVEGGKHGEIKPCAPGKGSTIQVKNLFYNTPARRKFLKKPATENQHIIEVVRRFALCYPEIAFNLVSGGREVFRLPTGELHDRIGRVFDRHYQAGLKAVALTKQPYVINGYVGNLSLVRGRPKEQYIFLNRRTVQDRLLNSAVYGAYKSVISRGEYPFFVLNIELPLDAVDVNVHPGKSEVRFRDEWRVYHVVKLAVSEAIKDIPGMIPDFDQPERTGGQSQFASFTSPNYTSGPSGTALFEQAPRPGGSSLPAAGDQVALTPGQTEDNNLRSPARRPEAAYNPESIWQVHNKYILSQVATGLVMIDQHVAHERVLYEEALKALTDKPLPSQTVLFPQVLDFAPDEFTRLVDMIPGLERLGFRIREFGKNSVVIDGVPTAVVWGRERELLSDLLDRAELKKSGMEYFEQLAAMYACKAAVKAGDQLSHEEMRGVVDRLFATDNPYFCPHGRPTIVHLSMAEMDRRFERI